MPHSPKGRPIAQAAAIPYRTDPATGRTDVLMIRRLDGRKWGIPKGSVEPDQDHPQAAQAEALQEAGVEGTLSPEPVGSFVYEKDRGGKKNRLGACEVRVFAMRVTKVHDCWDEDRKRERRWFPIDEAADVVGRDAVARLIRRLGEMLRPKPHGR